MPLSNASVLHSPAGLQLAHCQLLTLLHIRAQAYSDHDDDDPSQANNNIERLNAERCAQSTKQEPILPPSVHRGRARANNRTICLSFFEASRRDVLTLGFTLRV
jgi:hypothetical protein